MTNTYPQSLAGLYEIDFLNLILKPIKLVNTKITDYNLIEIRFENGWGNAIFENGKVLTLNVKFNERTTAYTFKFGKTDHLSEGANHIFEIKAHLGGLCKTVDIMSLIDFGEVSKD
ncbi:MAG: hypothetical protein WAU36_18885 [Cyclobacteriaceae bacterium]